MFRRPVVREVVPQLEDAAVFWPPAVMCAKVSLSETVTPRCFTPALQPHGNTPMYKNCTVHEATFAGEAV